MSETPQVDEAERLRQSIAAGEAARELYRREKAKARPRLTARQAALEATAKAIADRQRAEYEAAHTGGRPRRHGLELRSDPANALVNHLRPYEGDR